MPKFKKGKIPSVFYKGARKGHVHSSFSLSICYQIFSDISDPVNIIAWRWRSIRYRTDLTKLFTIGSCFSKSFVRKVWIRLYTRDKHRETLVYQTTLIVTGARSHNPFEETPPPPTKKKKKKKEEEDNNKILLTFRKKYSTYNTGIFRVSTVMISQSIMWTAQQGTFAACAVQIIKPDRTTPLTKCSISRSSSCSR